MQVMPGRPPVEVRIIDGHVAKACTRCGEWKPLTTGFQRNAQHTTGYRSECKVCKKQSRLLNRPRGLPPKPKGRQVGYSPAEPPIEEVVVKELYRRRLELADFHRFRGKDVFEYKDVLFSASEVELENLKMLPPKQRAAFFYTVVLDMTHKETADALGVSGGTIQQAVSTATAKLAEFHFPGYKDKGATEVTPLIDDPELVT